MPDEPEALGLLALMLFHDARSAARVDAAGDLVVLDEQDRSLFDAAAIAEGHERLDAALRLRRPGPFQVQAAIAACHVGDADETDWAEIAALYERLHEMSPSAVIALNRAVAVSMTEGPDAGLALIELIAPRTACPTTTSCRRHAATCCGASAAGRRRPRPTAWPATWRAPTRSGVTSSGAAVTCRSDAEAAEGRVTRSAVRQHRFDGAGLTGRDAVAIVSPGPPPSWRPAARNREDG